MSKKRNSVKVGLIKGNNISTDTKPDIQSFKEAVKKGNTPDVNKKPGYIISRVDYPVDCKYGDDVIRVSPRAKLKVGDLSKLENPLPQGLVSKSL
jgi:hypothetical protein